jgi:hypothetical protein
VSGPDTGKTPEQIREEARQELAKIKAEKAKKDGGK